MDNLFVVLGDICDERAMISVITSYLRENRDSEVVLVAIDRELYGCFSGALRAGDGR